MSSGSDPAKRGIADERHEDGSTAFPPLPHILTMGHMPFRSLVDFLEDLGHSGACVRIEEPLDPVLTVAEKIAQSAKSGGPALLFGAVNGHAIPVLGNLLATEGRICRALSVESVGEVRDRIARLLDAGVSENWLERLKGGSQPAAISAVAPRKVRSAPCQQIVRLGSDVNLEELPLQKVLEEESAPAFYTATVVSTEPDSHRPIFGQCDLLRIDAQRMAILGAEHDDQARLLTEYRSRGQKMPLAVIVGGDPAFLLAAAAPLPSGSDAGAVAGLLRERSLDVVSCRTVDLDVPAEAEMILEGFLDPAVAPSIAGPVCGPMGELSHPRPAPTFHVTAVTHRANPIFTMMVPGRPPHERVTVSRTMQRVFLPLARSAMPELVDYDLPEFGAGRSWAAVSIRKTHAGQGRRAFHRAWNLPALAYAKMLIVVDADVDVHDQERVLAAVTANMRPDRNVLVEPGLADPYEPSAESSQRMAIDATRKMDCE